MEKTTKEISARLKAFADAIETSEDNLAGLTAEPLMYLAGISNEIAAEVTGTDVMRTATVYRNLSDLVKTGADIITDKLDDSVKAYVRISAGDPAELESAMNAATQAEAEVNKLKSEVFSLSERVKELKGQKDQLDKEIDLLRDEYEETDKALENSRLEELKLKALIEELSKKNQNLRDLQSEIDKKKIQLEGLNATIDAFPEEDKALARDIEQKKAELERLRNLRNSNASEEHNNLSVQVDQLQNEVNLWEEKHNRLNKAIEELEAAKANYSKECVLLTENITAAVKNALTAILPFVEDYKKDINKTSEEVDKVIGEIKKADSAREAYKAWLDSDKELSASFSSRNGLTAAQISSVGKLNSEIEKLLSEYDDIIRNCVVKASAEYSKIYEKATEI